MQARVMESEEAGQVWGCGGADSSFPSAGKRQQSLGTGKLAQK